MRPPLRTLLAAVAAAGLCAAPARAAANPPADPDAMREARRPPAPGRFTSPRAVAHYLTARQKAVRGDLAGASEELRLAVAYDDESAELRAAYAEALALTGRVEAAEAEARRALQLDGEGRPAAAAHVLLGRILAARREAPAALRELQAAIAIEAARGTAEEPADPEPWRVAAEVQLEAGDADGALRSLEDAATRLGEDGGGHRELGRALLEKRDLSRAERALRRAVELRRDDVEAWRLLATAHEELRRPPEARDDWLALLRAEPDDADALLGLGRLALRDGDVGAAREWFGRHLRAAGDGQEPHLRIGFEWLDAHRAEDALRTAREGLAQAPGDAKLRLVEGLSLLELRRFDEAARSLAEVPAGAGETWFSARGALADALSRAGRHAEAVAALDPALAARPGDPRLVSARALVLGRAGRSAEAVTQLRAVLAEREKAGDAAALAELYPALADALVRAGQAGEAVAALRAGLEARPRDEALLYALGAAYERAGRTDEAVAQMRALLALDPDHAEALNFVGYSYAEQGVRLDEAEELVRRALRLAPRSGHMVDSLGWIRFRKGDYKQAVELLEEADRLTGPDASILEHLGDAYHAAARPADAAAAWRRALKSFGDETPAEQLATRASLERKLRDLGASAERRPVAR